MPLFKMTKTILKSLCMKPATVKYPFGPREYHKRTRGKVFIDVDQCILCSLCQRKCPTGAIVVNRNDKTWEIDPYRCISCGACVEACPKKCLRLDNKYSKTSTKKEKELFRHA